MFNIGAKVKLKSGSPVMAVVQVFDDGNVRVVWFYRGGNKEAVFVAEALVLVES